MNPVGSVMVKSGQSGKLCDRQTEAEDIPDTVPISVPLICDIGISVPVKYP